jgi:hemoglobin/transferrin/lactoferrin receptor protein
MRRNHLLMTSALVAAATLGQGTQAQELGFTLDAITLGSALRDERALLDTPVSASIVSGEALANRQAGDFQELIGDLPGLTIDGGPRGISHEPNIRGFRDEQIVLRFDGGRFTFGQAHRGRFFLDPDLVRSVEVVRGGGSSLYGSGALGGVISVETVDAADLLAPGQAMGGRVSLGFASNGAQANASTTLYADYGMVDLLFFLGGRQVTEDIEAGGGLPVPFSQIDQANTLFKIGVEPNDENRIEFSYAFHTDEGLTPPNSNSNPDPTSNAVVLRQADVQDLRLGWDYQPTGSDLVDLSVLFYASRVDITETRDTPAPRRDETAYETLGFEVVNRSTLDLGAPVDLVYGFEMLRDSQVGRRTEGGVTGPRAAFPEAEALTTAAFLEATIGLGAAVDLTAGLRYDRYQRDPADPTLARVDEEFLSPRLGISYRPNDSWQIYGNVARAFRAPSLSELYNDGVHFSTGAGFPLFPPNPLAAGLPPGTFFSGNNFFVPNPALEPEASTQFEIGARHDAGGVFRPGDRLTASVNAYYADVTNFIDSEVLFVDPATFTPAMGGPFPGTVDGTTRTRNVDATLWGFEAELDYDTGQWHAGAGLSIARGEGADGSALGSIPQDRLTLSGGYRPAEDWEIGARATFAADQTRTPSGTTAPGYQLLDLYATWTPEMRGFGDATIRFGLDNVFDERYTIYPNGLPQPGRSFEISASFTF